MLLNAKYLGVDQGGIVPPVDDFFYSLDFRFQLNSLYIPVLFF